MTIHEAKPESVLLVERLKMLGFTFQLNNASDTIEGTDTVLTDMFEAEIRVALRDDGLVKKLDAAKMRISPKKRNVPPDPRLFRRA